MINLYLIPNPNSPLISIEQAEEQAAAKAALIAQQQQAKVFYSNPNSQHPNQNHPLYQDPEDLEQPTKVTIKEELMEPYSIKNPSCYKLSNQFKVIDFKDCRPLFNLVFDRAKAEQLYQANFTSEQVQHTIELMTIYQNIANDPQLKDTDWCLIIRDDLELVENFSDKVFAITNNLNIAGNMVVLSNQTIHDFNKALVNGHTSKYRFHRYNPLSDCHFFSRGNDLNFCSSCFLIRKSLAQEIIKRSFKQGFYNLAGDLDLINKLYFFPIYVRGIFAIDKNPIPGINLLPKYTGIPLLISKASLWVNAYYRQLLITSNLDRSPNSKHGF